MFENRIIKKKFWFLLNCSLLWVFIYIIYKFVDGDNFVPIELIKYSINKLHDPLLSISSKISSVGSSLTLVIFFVSILTTIPLAWFYFALGKYSAAYKIIILPFGPLIILMSVLLIGLAHYVGGFDFMQN